MIITKKNYDNGPFNKTYLFNQKKKFVNTWTRQVNLCVLSMREYRFLIETFNLYLSYNSYDIHTYVQHIYIYI